MLTVQQHKAPHKQTNHIKTKAKLNMPLVFPGDNGGSTGGGGGGNPAPYSDTSEYVTFSLKYREK